MGAIRTTDREKAAALQMGFSVQICIWLGKTQIQSSARREGLQTRTWDWLRFSHLVKMTTLRLLLGVVAIEDLELEQLDVKTTFLHGDLDEDIYMSQPVGFSATGEESHIVHWLKKSLYGLKQASRMWYQKFNSYIRRLGKIPYTSAVGSITYAMVATRPDLAYVIGVVSR